MRKWAREGTTPPDGKHFMLSFSFYYIEHKIIFFGSAYTVLLNISNRFYEPQRMARSRRILSLFGESSITLLDN